MLLSSKSCKPLTEAKYLAVENAWRYRGIMRVFYISDMRFKHWLSKEDVFAGVKELELFADYTIDLCRQDLDALCSWGNLTAVQDASKVATYQQFVNKQYRYQMSEYAIEIERMAVRLENLFLEGGSLEPSLLERIKDELMKIREMAGADAATAGGWWSQLTSDFQRLNQNYQDYIRDWNSTKAEALMKTASFLAYKEKLVEYLRSFVKGLQQHGYDIARVLRDVPEVELSALWELIIRYEQEIPRIDMEQIRPEELRASILGKYASIEEFFCGGGGRESEVEVILSMTNEIIRRITRYAANILELSSQFSNRKDEYLQVARLFQRASSPEDGDRQTESPQSSIFDEAPIRVVLAPRLRTYREKLQKTAIPDQQEKKARMREAVLARQAKEQEILQGYVANGRIDFAGLGCLSAGVRRTLLRWLARGIRERGQVTVTEYGHRYTLANPQVLEMPAYVLCFEDDGLAKVSL